MKRILMVGAAVLGMVSAVGAAPSVFWGHSLANNVILKFGTSGMATDNWLPAGSIVQLIVSTDTTLNQIPDTIMFGADSPFAARGNDEPAAQSTIGTHTTPAYQGLNGVFYYGSYDFGPTLGAGATNLNVFMRVFDVSSTVLSVGQVIHYYEGGGPVSPVNPPTTPGSVDILAGVPNNTGLALNKTVTIVPEPTSALYLLVAAGALVLRRIRRRN